MRTRTAKKLAQRIDLQYFKRPHPLRRWRTILSIAAPALALLWLGGMAMAGSRAAYSSGPVSSSHAFAEMRCEVCHVRSTAYRAHVEDTACLTCHDAPVHGANQTAPPACAECHREHRGRIALSATSDAFCVRCHGDLQTIRGAPVVARQVAAFPGAHPEFAAARADARDPGTVRFNHETHLKGDLRGPAGAETLRCETCHTPEVARVSSRRPAATGLMRPIKYEPQCARCHPLYFDERVDRVAPHGPPEAVRAFVRESLRDHIDTHPEDLTRPDGPSRRVPLNFPRVSEAPPRNAAEWVDRRAARAERLLWERTCAYCHGVSGLRASDHMPRIRAASVPRQWMPKAAFDHMPHLMVECTSCHTAEQSRDTGDVLMPGVDICATCHAPDKGAESRCFECHWYHDWTKAQPMKSQFKLSDFQ